MRCPRGGFAAAPGKKTCIVLCSQSEPRNIGRDGALTARSTGTSLSGGRPAVRTPNTASLATATQCTTTAIARPIFARIGLVLSRGSSPAKSLQSHCWGAIVAPHGLPSELTHGRCGPRLNAPSRKACVAECLQPKRASARKTNRRSLGQPRDLLTCWD